MWSWLDPAERRAVAADRWLARLHRDGSPTTMARYRQWQSRDPRHAAAIAEAEQVWRTTGKISAELAARIRDAGQGGNPSPLHSNRAALLALAAALVLVAGGAVLLRLFRSPGIGPVAITAFAADQSVRLVPLSDGSAVTLDRGASVKIAFDASTRTIDLLRGRARFSVAHDPARPFTVLAGDRRVTAVGTMFEVTHAGDRVTVAMLQGVVEVAPSGSTSPTLPTRLMRGQMLETVHGEDRVAAVDATVGHWGTRLDRLDGLSLAAILTRANRGGGKPILLADPDLRPAKVEGQLPIRDTRALANQLAAALDLDLVEAPNGYVLSPRH